MAKSNPQNKTLVPKEYVLRQRPVSASSVVTAIIGMKTKVKEKQPKVIPSKVMKIPDPDIQQQVEHQNQQLSVTHQQENESMAQGNTPLN